MDEVLVKTSTSTPPLKAIRDLTQLEDIAIICQDQKVIKAHKVVLCSQSNVFKTIIQENLYNSLIFMRGIDFEEMKALLDLLYFGEVGLKQVKLASFMDTAKDLGVIDVDIKWNEKEMVEVDADENGIHVSKSKLDSNEEIGKDQDGVELDQSEVIPLNPIMSEDGKKYSDGKEVLPQTNVNRSRNANCHTEEHKRFCKDCSFSCMTTTGLNLHRQNVHEGIKYPCDECDMVFNFKGNHKRHVLVVHKNMQYQCTYCDKRFKEARGIKEHTDAVHKGIRHPCQFCDFVAMTRRGFRNHVDKIHKK